MSSIPLSLYIHIPWCVKKCPYCDFNSHAASEIPEKEYIQKLSIDLIQELASLKEHSSIQKPYIQSIFFGGGTPSLFHPNSIGTILEHAAQFTHFAQDIEITLEANPGTLEHQDFNDYAAAGINRISLGVQSFDNTKLKALGRIHSSKEVMNALDKLEHSNIKTFNIDLMYGLPNQTLEEALQDLECAIKINPPHLSWYHLTLEPNTVFYKFPPPIPDHDLAFDMQTKGHEFLIAQGYKHYEISAFAKSGHECRHNLNYWEFGDYLGIGAGAHGKITHLKEGKIQAIERISKKILPKSYLNSDSLIAQKRLLTQDEIPLEFMMNALRLNHGFDAKIFEERTGITLLEIESILQTAEEKQFITRANEKIMPTPQGRLFLNDLLALF